MDVEPGQSHATEASSTGSAGEHVPADPGAGDSGKGAIGEDRVENASAGNGAVETGSADQGGGPGKGGADKGGTDQGGADQGTAETGTGENGTADSDTAAADNGKAPGEKGKRKRSFWRELFVIIIAALVLTILIKAFLVQVFSIPSASMQNTLQPGDRILVNRLVYHLRDVARGDVVVFSGDGSWGPEPPPAPSNPVARIWDDITGLVGVSVPGTDYVKRVIGLPGDRVVCCDTSGRVTVNGVPLSEQSYIYPGDAPSMMKFDVRVPAGRLFVLGDHRSDSADSRYHPDAPGNGTIPENEVVGRAFVIIWPPSRIGDIPIPETFKQAALNSATAAVSLAPAVTGGAAAAGALAWRRRDRKGDGPSARPDGQADLKAGRAA